MRPLHVGLILAALVLVGVGALFLMSGGSPFSRGHHEWRIVVEPQGEGTWALFAPRIMGGDEDAARALDAMLSELTVTEGRAGFALDHMRIRIDGEGRAVLVARREFSSMDAVGEREAFSRWSVPALNVTHVEGPALDVTWSVDFSGGEGHTCWATQALRASVASGESRSLAVAEGPSPPPGSGARPWPVLCA